jgi:hypothetical protein
MKTRLLPRLLLAFTVLAFACNAPFWPQAGGGGGQLVEVAPPEPLLAPETYADAAQALAEAIAELNRVQEQTIEHLRTSPTPETIDADLAQAGAAAFTVAQLAEQLAASTASQAGASDQAVAAAAPYVAAAQMGYVIVIETQNAREDFKAGRLSGEQVAGIIGEQGSRLWSGDYFDPAVTPRPFADSGENVASVPSPAALSSDTAEAVRAEVDNTSGKDTELSAWNSSSTGTRTIRIIVPAPRSLGAGNGLDPSQLSQMRTPEGQANADIVRLAAASQLVSLGGLKIRGDVTPAFGLFKIIALQDGSYVIEITLPEAMVFQSQLGRPLPYFEGGQAGVTSTADSGGPLVSSLKVLDGRPQVDPPVEVTTGTAAVTLEILSAVPAGNVGADTRDVTLTVQWSTSMANPAFTLACFTGSGASASVPVNGASGEMGLTLAFSRLRDTAVCHAKSADLATTLGESQVIAVEPEGDDAATQAAIDAQATLDAAAPPQPASQTFDGSFNLSQSDDGCNFSAAPATGGSFQIVADAKPGTVSGSFTGGGQGVRPDLECTGNFADLTWNQSYNGTFSGTIDSAGNLNMTGTLSGSGNSTWSDCHDANNQPFDCPANESGPYSYPIVVTGVLDEATGGSGTIAVNDINLATSGTWAVGTVALPQFTATPEGGAAGLPTAGPTATRVETLGTGDVQITLIWNTINDLDLHVTDPDGEFIYFGYPASSSGGVLDVDANGGCTDNITPSPVENVFWPTGSAPTGTYVIEVHYYTNCPDAPLADSYTVRVLVDGQPQEFSGTVADIDELDVVHEFTR